MATPRLPASTTAKKNPRIADILAGVRSRTGALATRAKQTSIGRGVTGAGQRLAARVRERPDSLTGLATNNYGKMIAAFTGGAVDETEPAQKFQAATRVAPSTVVLLAGLVTRVLGLDVNSPQLRAVNTATLVGLSLPKIRDLGARVTKGARAAAAVPSTSGVAGVAGVAGAYRTTGSAYQPGESETDRPSEGIPGEGTIS